MGIPRSAAVTMSKNLSPSGSSLSSWSLGALGLDSPVYGSCSAAGDHLLRGMLYLLLLQGRPLLNPSTLTCHLVAAEYEGVKEETWSSKDMLQVSRLCGLTGQPKCLFRFSVSGASVLVLSL